jgi:hypothetical protein
MFNIQQGISMVEGKKMNVQYPITNTECPRKKEREKDERKRK